MRGFVLLLIGLYCMQARAQHILDRKIDLDVSQKSVYFTLTQMEKAGNFVFSYNSDLLPKDSLLSIRLNQTSIADVLEILFQNRFRYSENKSFLVINKPLRPLKIITTDITSDQQIYSVSGLVVDGISGDRLMNVSVYEKAQLVAALTDEHGYFKLKFKSGNSQALTITASKLLFEDASVNFLQSVSISSRIRQSSYKQAIDHRNGVEGDPLGRFLITAKQQIQSLNIPDFFAKRPFQVSLTPGLSTHGLLTSQVVNKFSLNLVGGYTAGLNGLEIGGLFNINRFDSRYFQFAGIFNLVGGTVTGLQLAGINNRALTDVHGVQLAGFVNKTERKVSGIQIAALNNEAHKLNGLQIGLVNVADTSEGASIGLVNIIRNGFYKVALSANNTMNTNIALTTGTHKFYTTIHAGANLSSGPLMLGLGIGVGHDFMLSNKFYLSGVLDYQVYGRGGNFRENWKQAKLLVNAQLFKNLSVFAGPTFRRYTYSAGFTYSYPNVLPPDYYTTFNYNPSKYAFGWEAGIALNSVFKAAPKVNRGSENWNIGAAAIGGLDIKSTNGIAGGELFMERELRGNLAAILSVGYIQHLVKNRTSFPAVYPGLIYMSYYDRNDFKSIPIKAGMKTYTGKRLFFSGELGAVIGLNNPNYLITLISDGSTTRTQVGKTLKAFTAGASIGYSFDNGLESGIKYEKYFGHDVQLMTFRMAYRLKLRP